MVKPSDKKGTKRVVFIGESHQPHTRVQRIREDLLRKVRENSSQLASYVANDWLPN